MPIDRASGGQEDPDAHDTPSSGTDEPAETHTTDSSSARPTAWLNIDHESTESLRAFLGYDRTDRVAGRSSGEAGRQGGQDVPEEMPVAEGGEPAVSDPQYRAWYRERSAEHPQAPAPFDARHAAEVSEYREGHGAQGRLVDDAGDFAWGGRSGYEGPAKEMGWQKLGLPSAGRWLASHVEAHTAALMRDRGMPEATLYINRAVCPNDYPEDHPARKFPFTCDTYLERMLPPDAKLTVFAPGGFCKIYRGRAHEGEAQG